MKAPSLHWGTIRWLCLGTADRGQIPHSHLGKPAKLTETLSLQFSPSCSSWGCSLKWSKLVKKLKFSSFTLLGQSFCGVPAHRFCYIGQMLRASRASLTGSLCQKATRLHVYQIQAKMQQSKGGIRSWPACTASTESGLCKNSRGGPKIEVIRIHFLNQLLKPDKLLLWW